MKGTRWVVASAIGVAMAGCGDEAYAPKIDPAHFVDGVSSRYFPLVNGVTYRYAVRETQEMVAVTTTAERKVIMGVTCVVVHDVATVGGVTTEDTYDWYAQDDEGNVWYFGEDTTAFDGGMQSKEGSWEGGVGGAQPGKVVLGQPRVGDSYREEYLKGVAEDQAEVVSLDASITVPYGSFGGCMETRDYSDLEPEVEEHKLFCPDVGQVDSFTTKGAAEHEELIGVSGP